MATNTVPTFTNHTGNGTAGPFNIGFNYIDKNEIIVRVNEVLKSTPTHYTFNSNTQITFTSGNEPASGLNIEFRRSTNITTAKVDFQDGSVLTETDLDANTNQLLFALQENTDAVNADNLESSSIYLRDGSRTLTGNIVFEGSTKDAHETTLTPVDPTADRTINIPNVSGTLVTTGDIGTVTTTMIADGTFVNADINANAAIAGTKVSPNFGSQNISTTGNVTATNFIGNGSQLTGITFTGIDQFLRRDIDDDCFGKIRFGSEISFGNTLTRDDGTDTSTANHQDVTFNGTHADNYMKWQPTSVSTQDSFLFGNSVNIGLQNNWQLRSGSSSDNTLWQFYQGIFQINLSANLGSPETTGTVANTPKTHNKFIINGNYNTNIPLTGTDAGSFINEQLVNWLVLETDPSSITGMRTAGFANQTILLRSNDNTILKVHKDGVDCLHGDIRVITDTGKLQLGASQDLQIYHNGSNSYIDNSSGSLYLRPKADEDGIVLAPDGSVELYHDNVKRLETASNGVTVTGNLNAALDGNTSISLQDTGHGFSASSIGLSNGGRDLNIVAPKDIRLKPTGGENGIVILDNGAVELYHDNVKKAETSSTGFDVTGTLKAKNKVNIHDNGTSTPMLQLTNSVTGSGTEDGFRIGYSTNSNVAFFIAGESNSAFQIKTGGSAANDERLNISNTGVFTVKSNSEDMLIATPNAGVELYYNNSKKLETTSTGVLINGHINLPDQVSGTGKIKLGDTNDLQLYHDGTDSFIQNSTGGLKILGDTIRLKANSTDENMLVANVNSSVSLYFDNALHFKTTSYGAQVLGTLLVGGHLRAASDAGRISAGADNDLEIFHNGANSFVAQKQDGTGNLYIESRGTKDLILRSGNGTSGAQLSILCTAEGATSLYFDAVKKIETTSTGVRVHGDIVPEADNTRALGASSKRFTTLHSAALNTGDINMSNLNDNANEVDGSRGSWTLQEGADDLFIINRVSGKKYKFNLTEIN